jgi:hypothetical protein
MPNGGGGLDWNMFKPNVNSPIPDQWRGFVTQQGSGLEVVPGQLYDTETYTSATTRELTFYTNIQAKNLNQTNMVQQGQLPWPESMLVLNIRLFFKSQLRVEESGVPTANLAAQANDVIQLTNMGVVELKIGEKSYGPFLPWTLPANSFVKAGIAQSGSDLLVDYAQLDGALYPFVPALVLAPMQQFKVKLSWPAAALTLSQNTDIVVIFDGQRARAIQ